MISREYANNSGMCWGYLRAKTLAYTLKHCIQVCRSGIIFLWPWIESADCTSKIFGPGVWEDLDRPWAGGNSVKSTNSQLRIFSASFFGSEGIPLPSETSAEVFPTEDKAAANESWEDEASANPGRESDELELQDTPADSKVAVSAGKDPASVTIKEHTWLLINT